MIINYFGIQLEVIDNGDGTFSVRALDADVDKAQIRAEIARIRGERDAVDATIGRLNTERDYHIERRDFFVSERTAAVAERDALVVRINELKLFLESAGETDV